MNSVKYATIEEKANVRVLIVDDDPDILASLEAVLEIEESYTIKMAPDARTAIDITNFFAPDIVLLDINLGISNGLDLLPVFKEKFPDAVCIMMTAYRDASYAVQAVKSGADDYIYKPLDTEKFIQTVKNHANNQILHKRERMADMRFRALFEQTFELVYLLDTDGTVLDLNHTAMNFNKTTKSNMVGKLLWDTVFCQGEPEVRAEVRESVGKALVGEVIQSEIKIVKGDNSYYMDCSVKGIAGDGSGPGLVIFECRDITERIIMEKQMNILNELLEQKVEERTRAYKEARDIARRASQAKSEFLSRMSHELRTPMNAILGFGELLEMNGDELSGEDNESVQQILVAGRHLLGLINEVLNLSKIEAGEVELYMEPVRLEGCIHDAWNQIAPMALNRNITLVNNYAGDASVIADPAKLKKALVNILSNAIRYNRRGGTVEVSVFEIENNRVRISFADTGTGISPEEMSQLFTPFERLNKEKNVEGVGIGLYLTKKLAELMNGSIWAESTPGEGSTFWLEFGSGRK